MAARRKTTESAETPVGLVEVTAEPFEDDPDWDGTVEEMPADTDSGDAVVDVPRRKGRAPLTLPAAAGRFEKAKAALQRLSALDVEAEREKLTAQAERVAERLAKLDGHETAVAEAHEELREAEAAFNAALAEIQGQ
jgi:hypothetical protein